MSSPADLSPTIICVLAHNEERRIARCLSSLPLAAPGIEVHVVVNGSHDRTAEIARGFAGVIVHDWEQGGKARSWNRFLLDTLRPGAAMVVLVDGDAEITPGSIAALAEALAGHPDANAASGLPANGRRMQAYRSAIIKEHGLFGDLYALRGSFVDRMRAANIRLPDDCIGDDGLIGAMVKTDLGPESAWQDGRVMPCLDAGFLCEQVSIAAPRSWTMQYARMRNYSLRHFQNLIISHIMRTSGPKGLPQRIAAHYAEWVPRFRPRRSLSWWWFDRLALARMRAVAAAPDAGA